MAADWTTSVKVPLVVSFLASAVTAVVAAYIGAASAVSALTFAGKLTGALMVAAALVLVAGLVATVRLLVGRGTRVVVTAIIVGTATALGVNIMMAVTQLAVGDVTHRLAYWVSLGALLAWALHDLVRALGPFGTYPRKLALGIGVSSLVAIANFAYSQIYLPYAQQPSIAMQPSFGTAQAAFDKSGTVVPFSVTLTTKKVPVFILSATYAVTGRKASIAGGVRSADALREDLNQRRHSSARLNVDGVEFVQGGDLVRPGSEYIPEEEHTATEVVRLPADTGYDSLQLTTWVTFLRADRATLRQDQLTRTLSDPPPPDKPERGQFVVYHGRLVEGNLVNRVTREPVWFWHQWAVGRRPGGPSVDAQTATVLTTDPTAGDPTAVDDAVSRRYGLWSQTEVVSLPLPR